MASVFFGISTRSFHYDRTIGRHEQRGTGFLQAADLALGPEHRIYVVNRGFEVFPHSVRATMVDLDEHYIGQFAYTGEGDVDMIWPSSIALDSDQNVYVADEWLNRISIFDKDGEYFGKWGVAGAADGEINKPACIRFDREDNMYIADGANNRVQVFTKDGRFLSSWGEAGTGEGQFNLPWGLAIDNNGDVYVADWRNDRVQKFTRDGGFLAEFGTSGSGLDEFNRPSAVAVDKDGDIYVADWLNERVQVLTPEGRHITTFTGDAGLSRLGQDKLKSNPDMLRMRGLVRDFTPEKRLGGPKSIAIDGEGRIFIVDSNRGRLQVYRKDNY